MTLPLSSSTSSPTQLSGGVENTSPAQERRIHMTLKVQRSLGLLEHLLNWLSIKIAGKHHWIVLKLPINQQEQEVFIKVNDLAKKLWLSKEDKQGLQLLIGYQGDWMAFIARKAQEQMQRLEQECPQQIRELQERLTDLRETVRTAPKNKTISLLKKIAKLLISRFYFTPAERELKTVEKEISRLNQRRRDMEAVCGTKEIQAYLQQPDFASHAQRLLSVFSSTENSFREQMDQFVEEFKRLSPLYFKKGEPYVDEINPFLHACLFSVKQENPLLARNILHHIRQLPTNLYEEDVEENAVKLSFLIMLQGCAERV